MNFSKEEVLKAYRLLTHGENTQVRTEADGYLNAFLVEETVTRDLHRPGDCPENS
jgi:hypothetical protein